MKTIQWVRDFCLRQFSNFSPISWREQVNVQWDDDEVRFVLDQHAELDLYSASSLKQQFAGKLEKVCYILSILNPRSL
jgi:hypothetical protein